MTKKTYKASVQIGTTVHTFERNTSNYFAWAVITQDKDNGKVACSFHKNYRAVEAKQQRNSRDWYLVHIKVVQAFEVKDN